MMIDLDDLLSSAIALIIDAFLICRIKDNHEAVPDRVIGDRFQSRPDAIAAGLRSAGMYLFAWPVVRNPVLQTVLGPECIAVGILMPEDRDDFCFLNVFQQCSEHFRDLRDGLYHGR